MEINDQAPIFSLPDENGQSISLRDYRGRHVVLYFFPKADTPGCTIEACGFRDAYSKIQKAGAVVLGISADTAEKQKKFKEKYNLPFTLLADSQRQVCQQYDVLKEKNMYGKKTIGIERTTFLIGPEGQIMRIFPAVKAQGHAEEVLAALPSAPLPRRQATTK